MTDNNKASKSQEKHFSQSNMQKERYFKVNEINYRNNLETDYTEKIEDLEKTFDYASNSTYFWGDPELSVLYGTPLYEAASESQKLALNHLYWAAQYDYIAASEASTVNYNQVTSGVFSHLGGYETLCLTLERETEQEKYHIHAFQNIGNKTKIALLGKRSLSLKLKKASNSTYDRYGELVSKFWQQVSHLNSASPSSNLPYSALRFLSKILLNSKTYSYSSYLEDLEKKGEVLKPSTKGYIGVATPQPLLQLLAFHWGSSPFLACQHYTYRFTGNMGLKNYEHSYSHYFKELENKGELIPVPTAVSHYHLLDESFHTTTSQLIGRDMYKDFPKPTAYEQFIANLVFYMMQHGLLGDFSGGIMATFRQDAFFMPYYYRILRSPLFDMSAQEALQWMEKFLCREHEGFHVQTKYHQRLLKNMCQLTSNLEYLWPLNREMRVMASGGSISKALQKNIKAFKQFSELVVE